MTEAGCDKEALSLHALGALADYGRDTVRSHVIWCDACRRELEEFTEVIAVLGELPPEAMLPGPPADNELLLQRTLATMRTEMSGASRRRTALVSAVAASIIAAAVAGGAVIGRSTVPQAGRANETTSGPANNVPGTREGSVRDPRTGVSLAAKVVPAAGGVRVAVSVHGIPAGEDCRVIVVSRTGARAVAGGWITSEKGKVAGTSLDGAAAIAPPDVAAIVIENTSGKRFVSLKI